MDNQPTELAADQGSDGANSIANDILRGAAKIGEYLGLTTRQVFYEVEKGDLPIFKDGATVTAFRSEIRAYYASRPRGKVNAR